MSLLSDPNADPNGTGSGKVYTARDRMFPPHRFGIKSISVVTVHNTVKNRKTPCRRSRRSSGEMAAVLPEQTVPTEAYILRSSAVLQRHGAVPKFLRTQRPLPTGKSLRYNVIHSIRRVGEYQQCLTAVQPVIGKCGSLYLCRDAAREPRRCTGRSVMPSIRHKTLLEHFTSFHRNLFRYTSRCSTR